VATILYLADGAATGLWIEQPSSAQVTGIHGALDLGLPVSGEFPIKAAIGV
jgi:hypothetical protein